MSKKYTDAGLASAAPLTGAEKWGIAVSGLDKYMTPAMLPNFLGGLLVLARTNGSEASGDETTLQFNVKDFDPQNTVTTGSSWHFTAPATKKYLVLILHMLIVPTGGMNYTAGDELKILRYATSGNKVVAQLTKDITGTQNEPYNTLLGVDIVSMASGDSLNYNFVRSVSDGDPTIASDALIAIFQLPEMS